MGSLTNFTHYGKTLVRDVFIETGSYVGETLARAVASGFRSCHSIDVSQHHYDTCRRRFAAQPHVQLHLGSSPDILRRIIDPSRATTFWLDAHYQGQGDDELDINGCECPVLSELVVILSTPWAVKPLILIDDAYLFTDTYWASCGITKRHGDTWPRLIQIIALTPPDYTWCVVNNEIIFIMPRDFYE